MDPLLNRAADGRSADPSPQEISDLQEGGTCPTPDNGRLDEGTSYDTASYLVQANGQPSSGAWTYTMAHLGSGDLAAAWDTPGHWDASEQSHLARPTLSAATPPADIQPLNPCQQLPSQAPAQPAQLATQHQQQQSLGLDGTVSNDFFLARTRSHVPTTDRSHLSVTGGLSGSTTAGLHRTGSYQPPFCPPEIGNLAQLYAIAAGLSCSEGPLDPNRSSAPVSGLVTSPQFGLADPPIQAAGTIRSQLAHLAPAMRPSGSISYGQSLSLPPGSDDFSTNSALLLQGSGMSRTGTQAQALLAGPTRGVSGASLTGRQRTALYDVGGQATLQQQTQLQPQQGQQRQQQQQQQVQAQWLQQHQQVPQWQQQLLQVVQQQQQQQGQLLYSNGPDEAQYPRQVQHWQQQQTVQQQQQQQLLYISGPTMEMQQQLPLQPIPQHQQLLMPGSEAGDDVLEMQQYSMQWQQQALQQQQQRPLFYSGGFEQVRQVHPLRQQPPLHIQQQQQQQLQQTLKHTMTADGRHTPNQLLSTLSHLSAMGSGTSFTSLAPSAPTFNSSAALSGASFVCTTPITAAHTLLATGSAASFLASAPSAAAANPSGVASGPAVHAPVLTPASASLYVKNLPPEATELMLYQKFSPFGPLMSCKVHVDSHGKCKGVGFVNFADHEDAMQAMQLHGARMSDGRHLHVEMQEPRALHAAPAW